MKTSIQHYSFLLIAFLLFSSSTAHLKPEDQPQAKPSPAVSEGSHDSPLKGLFSRVFAFGDSDTDKGNAPLLAQGQGKQGEHALGLNNSFDNPSRLVIDFLCSALNIKPLPPFMKAGGDSSSGVSFGVTGSTALSNDLFTKKNVSSLFWKGAPENFKMQIEWFNEFINKATGKGNIKGSAGGKAAGGGHADVSDALFWIGQMGVSDYTSGAGSAISLHKLAESSVKHVMELLATIKANGGRSIIVQGLPPVGCCPLFMALTSKLNLDHSGCMRPINLAIMAHNKILQLALEKFRKDNPECTVLYADYWSAYLAVVTHPEKYGMVEPFKACCGSGDGDFNFNKNKMCGAPGTTVCKDPNKYVNWDGVRLTEGMHKLLTDMFLHKGYCQPPFEELIKKRSAKKCA